MLSIWIIITIIGSHFIADYVFQDYEWAATKSYRMLSLFKHTIVYSSMMAAALAAFHLGEQNLGEQMDKILVFWVITWLTHTLQDFITSKITAGLYRKKLFGGRIPNWGFFTMLGLDQMLHMFQLFVVYYLLFT